MRRWLLAALAVASSTGCTGPAGCLEGACPAQTVCELDGRCRPLSESDGHRFATARRLSPIDWGATVRSDRRANLRAHAEWPLGGDVNGEAHFVFELPEREIVQAVLTVHPSAAPPESAARLLPFRTPYFTGETLDRSTSPRPRTRGHARRVHAQPGRPIRIDVTALVRGQDAGRVHLGLAVQSERALRIASPVASDAGQHPTLDVRWL